MCKSNIEGANTNTTITITITTTTTNTNTNTTNTIYYNLYIGGVACLSGARERE